MEVFSGLKVMLVALLFASALALYLFFASNRKRRGAGYEHAATMYLCGEGEELVFKRANYDLTSMLIDILKLERIRLADIKELDRALMLMVFVLSISIFVVMIWISLRGL